MSIELNANAKGIGKPLTHFWNFCVGAGRANEGLRANWLEHMGKVRNDCGFRYVRFHGLFHDDMFVYWVKDGQESFNFQYIDDLFDRLLEMGVRPFVELGFCPKDLATQTNTEFWWQANASPPKDYGKWAELVTRTLTHWIERYGADEVRQWYFEIWNEPNLWPFFTGTRKQYFELYKVTAIAIKSLDRQLRVGGPATSSFVADGRFDGETEDRLQHEVINKAEDLDALDWKPPWLEEFLTFCHEEQLPVDFVSCHPYPTDWALDGHGVVKQRMRSVNSTRQDLALVKKIVEAGPYPKAEIHLTEWSSSPSSRDFMHDYTPAATFVVKANLESIGLVDSLAYWTFTDVFEEHGAGNSIFHGGFGMINFQGIVKPTFHAYRMLGSLGDELLASTTGGVVTRHKQTGKITALLYHYPEEVKTAAPSSFKTRNIAEATLKIGSSDQCQLIISGLQADTTWEIQTLGIGSGDAITAWRDMGMPEPPSREQTRELKTLAESLRQEIAHANANGELQLNLSLNPWDVVLVQQL